MEQKAIYVNKSNLDKELNPWLRSGWEVIFISPENVSVSNPRCVQVVSGGFLVILKKGKFV